MLNFLPHDVRGYFIGLILWGSLFACNKPSAQRTVGELDTIAFHFDWNAISGQLLQRVSIEPGERILLVAKPGKFDPLIPRLKEWIEEAKGVYLGTICVDTTIEDLPDVWNTEFTAAAKGSSLEGLVERFKTVDLGFMLPGAAVSDKPYAAMQRVLGMGHGRTIHFHWSGAYSFSGDLLPVTEAIDRHYQNAILATDYRRLSDLQHYFEQAARSRDIRVTTPLGTDLTFSLGDRPVTKQDGDASKGRIYYAKNLIDREIEIPAGAIRVAPIEETVEGTIAFPDTDWGGTLVKGLVLTFHRGRVIDMIADSGLQSVKNELDSAGDAGYAFREFALGFNPLLAIPVEGEKWIPYYGYGAGVVRLSLGDNTELGGTVSGGYVRWNFFTDATVTVGNAVIVSAGKMLQ